MKKHKTILLIIISIIFCGNISAQSFLKKLGKEIEKVGKEIEKISSESNNNTTEPSTIKTENLEENNQPSQTTNIKLDNVIDWLDGNIKEITETNIWMRKTTYNIFHFNEQKQITEIKLSSYNGNVSVEITFEYNPNGSISKRTYLKKEKSNNQSLLGAANEIHGITINELASSDNEINSESAYGETDETQTYYYNNIGKLIKVVGMHKSEYTAGTTEEHYNADQQIIKRVTKSNDNVDEYTFDSKGTLVSHKQNGEVAPQYDDEFEGGDYSEPKIQRDALGRITSIESDMMSTKYTYNTNGYLSSVKESGRWWGDASTTYTGYLYDAHRNWIKRTVKKIGDYYGKNGLTVTTTRQITYY